MENKVILLNGGRDYDVEPLPSADAYLARLLGSESSRRAMFFLESIENEGGDLRVAVFVGGQHVGNLAEDIDKGLVATVKACEVHGVVARARGSLSASQGQQGSVIMRVDLADADNLLTSTELPATPAEPQTQPAEELKVQAPESQSEPAKKPRVQAPAPVAKPVDDLKTQAPEPVADPAEEPKVEAPEPESQHLQELQALPVEELQPLPVEELKPHAPEEIQMPAALPFPAPAKPHTAPSEETPDVPTSIAVPGAAGKAASALSASFEDAAALIDLEGAAETDSQPETDSEILDNPPATGVSVDPTADFVEWPPPKPKPATPIAPAAPIAPATPVAPVAPTAAPEPVVSEPVAPEPAEPPRSTAPTMATAPLEPTTPVQPATPQPTAPVQAPVPVQAPAPAQPTVPVQPAEPQTVRPDRPPSESETEAPEQDHEWFKSFSTKRSSWIEDSGQTETPQPGWLGFKASQKSKPDAAKEGADRPNRPEGD